jgi:predicted amidophosphoribosyltransferase
VVITSSTRISRWFNVENVFYIKNRENLTGKKILLVDDVITTGATMEAIIQKLNEIEGTQIFVATLTAAET